MYQNPKLIKNYTTSVRERIREIKEKWTATSSKYNDSLQEFEEVRYDIYLLYTTYKLSYRTTLLN